VIDEFGLRGKDMSVRTVQQINQINHNQLDTNSEKKLTIITGGLQKYFYKQLIEQISEENRITIADYILTQKTEVNLADSYRANILTTLISLSKLLDNKPFKNMTREDILCYLDTVRKSEAFDPQQQMDR
jgi:hypothetical protein